MNENRRQILDMLAQGKITAEEAERLLAAIEKAADGTGDGEPRKAEAKYLRVEVESDKNTGEVPTKVNIRVPIKLLRAGVRLAGLLPQEARQQVNEAMRQKGVDFDITQLRPENVDSLIDHLQDLEVDVDQRSGKTAKVKLFCE